MNLQDAFLNQVRIQKIPVTIYLVGGHQIKGFVKGFDSYIIMLDVSGKYNLVYKHAISTIIPLKAVMSFRQEDEPTEAEEKISSSQAGLTPETEEKPTDEPTA
ncbi:RNA chaperone Hfq [Ruminococcaceae bacterium OttesenSCG-928-L11]|nr:RNA chaperone Hfq [Ruminococcaceae bacterium OttesenSCG-928-L11]